MIDLETFALRWKDFHTNAGEAFQSMREDEDFCDVTLVSDDLHNLQAHKVILSSCSPVLKHMLKPNKHNTYPMLLLKGVKKKQLTQVVDFVYTGSVSIYQEDLEEFLRVATEVKIKGIQSDEKEDRENV